MEDKKKKKKEGKKKKKKKRRSGMCKAKQAPPPLVQLLLRNATMLHTEAFLAQKSSSQKKTSFSYKEYVDSFDGKLLHWSVLKSSFPKNAPLKHKF